jgi:uncharacterized protein (TIGR02466 family)
MEPFPLFPIPLHISEAHAPTPSELATLRNQSWRPNPGGGNQTSENSHLLDLPELSALRAFLQSQIDLFAHDILAIKRTNRFYITQSWVNINAQGTSHHVHLHQNSLISGVYFVEGDNSPIAFMRPPSHQLFGNISLEMERTTPLNAVDCAFPNQQHKAMLFPSTTMHFVPEHRAVGPRMSLAFNTFVRGTLGTIRDLTELKL